MLLDSTCVGLMNLILDRMENQESRIQNSGLEDAWLFGLSG